MTAVSGKDYFRETVNCIMSKVVQVAPPNISIVSMVDDPASESVLITYRIYYTVVTPANATDVTLATSAQDMYIKFVTYMSASNTNDYFVPILNDICSSQHDGKTAQYCFPSSFTSDAPQFKPPVILAPSATSAPSRGSSSSSSSSALGFDTSSWNLYTIILVVVAGILCLTFVLCLYIAVYFTRMFRKSSEDDNRMSLSETLPRPSGGGDDVTAVQSTVKPNATLNHVESSNPEADAALDML